MRIVEEQLIKVKNDAGSLIMEAHDAEELNAIKLSFLGKNGKLTNAISELRNVPEERRAEVGRLANEIKRSVEGLIEQKEDEFKTSQKMVTKKETLDVTRPGIKPALGHLHLVTQAIDEISEIFARIGFKRVRYPEVEWDWYAFGALNFPDNHPARDDWETFFIKEEPSEKYGSMLLTPHTSSGQIREMRNAVESASGGQIPPIKMLNIAKTYRRQSDVSHTAMFHQFETLYIDKKVSITHLKGTLDYFVKSWFGENRKSRIRPYHFQFTEPSFETDVSCGVCDGAGCKLCKGGWLELGGAGMVHPNVIKAVGLDPAEYSGFASGWGVERVLMMREGMALDDLRTLYSNNLDFLEQF